LFLACVMFFTQGRCFGDVAAQLSQADKLMNAGYYGQADGIYKTIVQSDRKSDSALKAQAKLVIINILMGKDAESQGDVEKLTADFGGNPELPALLYGIAQRYKASWKTAEADKIFGQLAKQYPGSYQFDKIQIGGVKEQIFRAINDGRMAEAKTEVDNLTRDFSSNSALAATLYQIAREYKENEKFDEAKEIYQLIVQQCVGSPYASKAKLGVVKMTIWSLIKEGKIAEAKAAVESFVKEFKDNPEFAAAYHGIGIRYIWAKNYGEAKSLFEQIIQQYPDSLEAEKSKIDIAKCRILSLFDTGKNDAATAAIDKATADFAGNSYLPKTLSEIAEQYYYRNFESGNGLSEAEKQANLQRAAAIWDKVINEQASSSITPQACCYAGDCYKRLGRYEKSAGYYQKVVDSFPSYRRIWDAYFMLGQNYESLKKAGTISAAEADAKIRPVYQQLVEKYPDCSVTKYAQQWLSY